MVKRNRTAHKSPALGEIDPFCRAMTCANAFDIGLSTWWKWVADGKVEKPIKLGPKTSVWRSSYIAQLQNELVEQEG